MRISTKGRYGLAAMILIAKQYESVQCSTILSISEKLGISKIYLEQVFSLLRRANLLVSIKGAQGGYKLAMPPDNITVLDILKAVEQSLFEETEKSVDVMASNIEAVMQTVYLALDDAIALALNNITLAKLASQSRKKDFDDSNMFYI